MIWKNFETNKLRTEQVTEYHVKKTSFFHFLGGRGGPIKLTLLIGGLDNLTRNLNTKFKIANLKIFYGPKTEIANNQSKL